MDNKNLMPQQAQPVNRITTGQLPSELMELSEEALSFVEEALSLVRSVQIQTVTFYLCEVGCYCSYDGEDAE